MNMSMYRKILGYSSGDRTQPIYAPMPGQLITQAFILCSQCNAAINHNMGPRRDAWCISCTDKNEEVIAKEKIAARKKATIRAAAEKKAAEAKKKIEATKGTDKDE